MIRGVTELALLDLDDGLARLGYQAFRPGQREAIRTLLDARAAAAGRADGRRQEPHLPAARRACCPGTSLVISPLVSLMHDQVQALEARGVPATFLAATLSAEAMRERLARLRRGAFKLAYVAPERLAYPGFRALALELGAPLVAVDEAHCISEWGHDFRPEYLQIGGLIAELRPRLVLACTATATPVVRDEILVRLGLGGRHAAAAAGLRAAEPGAPRAARGVRAGARPVRWTRSSRRRSALRAPRAGRRSSTRRHGESTEEQAARLRGARLARERLPRGLRRRDPHARRSARSRTARSTWSSPPTRSAWASTAPTCARSSTWRRRARSRPTTRRSAAPAATARRPFGLLLHSPGDLPLRRRLIESGGGGEAPRPEVVEHKWSLFLELMRWAEGGSCRHDAILRYFGDEAETLAGCGRCDVCRQMDGDSASEEETSLMVRKALCAVARVDRRYGLTAAVEAAGAACPTRGSSAPGSTARRPSARCASHSEPWLTQLLRRCVTAGWVDFTPGDKPVVLLTGSGRAVMKGERPARLVLPREHEPEALPRAARRRRRRRPRARRGARSPAARGACPSSRRCAACAPSSRARTACPPTSSPATARCATSRSCARAGSRR